MSVSNRRDGGAGVHGGHGVHESHGSGSKSEVPVCERVPRAILTAAASGKVRTAEAAVVPSADVRIHAMGITASIAATGATRMAGSRL